MRMFISTLDSDAAVDGALRREGDGGLVGEGEAKSRSKLKWDLKVVVMQGRRRVLCPYCVLCCVFLGVACCQPTR